jgi:hypothetical protein
MKIEEMVDIFLNSSNFVKHTFLTLAPPSSYSFNLKALIKLSKVIYEILRSSFEREFDKTDFISRKRTPPKSPHCLGLMYIASNPNLFKTILLKAANIVLKFFKFLPFFSETKMVLPNDRNSDQYRESAWVFFNIFTMDLENQVEIVKRGQQFWFHKVS